MYNSRKILVIGTSYYDLRDYKKVNCVPYGYERVVYEDSNSWSVMRLLNDYNDALK